MGFLLTGGLTPGGQNWDLGPAESLGFPGSRELGWPPARMRATVRFCVFNVKMSVAV